MDAFYKLLGFQAVKHHGLINHGATCYLNSVLQVLFMTREFRQAVSSFTDDNPDAEGFIDADLKDLFDDLLRGTTDTHKIIKALKIDSVSEQQDAAEYFEKILNLTSPDAAKIFHGNMANRTTCSKCSKVTDTDGQFCHLPFELQDSVSGSYSVVDGIEKYFQPSYFSGDNQMYCDECDGKVDASSKYVIKHHPDVLVLLLKRFDFSYRYMSYIKIQCGVDVPYTLNIPENQTYELYAVVDHFGHLRAGHYAATIKSQDDETWFSFDDSRVTPLDRSPFSDTQNISRFASAYLLFYRKKAVILEKINNPKKRSRNENTDENDPETKRTKQESDTKDQDEHKTLLSNVDRKEINYPENIELTNINRTTPVVKISVKPGYSEASADRQDDRIGPPGGFRDEEGTRIEYETESTCFHEKDTTANNKNAEDQSDQNTDKEPENVGLTDTKDVKPNINPESGDSETSSDRQDDRIGPPGGFRDGEIKVTKIKDDNNSSNSLEDMTSKDNNQDINRYLLFSEEVIKSTHLEEPELTVVDHNRPEVSHDFNTGDREKVVSAACDTQDDRSDADRPTMNTTDQLNQTEISDSHGHVMKSKDENTDDQEENMNLISTEIFTRTEVTNSETSEQTETKPDAETSADKQDKTRDPPGGFSDEETERLEIQHVPESSNSHTEDMTVNNKNTDDQEEKLSDKGQNERLVSCERSVECDRRGETSDPQAEDRSLSSTGDQTVVKEPDEAERTDSNQVTAVNLKNISSSETSADRQEDMKDPPGKFRGEETENSDIHPKNMNWNNNEQEKDQDLLPREDQNKVTGPENVGLTDTKDKKPDVHPESGDSEASAESQSPKINTTDEIKQTGNSDRHEDRTSEVKDPVEAESTAIVQKTQAVKLSLKPGDSDDSAVSAGHGTQDDTSDAQRLTMKTTTDNIKQTETSDSHENMRCKDSDQIKDRSLSSTAEQAVVKEPGDDEVTHINQMTVDVNLQPGDSEMSALPVHDEMNPALSKITNLTTGDNTKAETSQEQDIKSKDINTDDREENRNLLSSEISHQAEAKNPEKSEQTEKLKPDVTPDVKPGDCKRSAEPVVFYNKTRSHEKKRLLDENTDENLMTAVSSERSEQKMTTKDDDDEVNKHLCDDVQVTMTNVEGGAERKPCIRKSKYIVMGVLAVLLALILLIVLFTLRL